MTMLGPRPKEGPPGVDELVEVLEEPLAPSDDLIISDSYPYYFIPMIIYINQVNEEPNRNENFVIHMTTPLL